MADTLMRDDFGGHSAEFAGALTLHEVGALLVRGAAAAGCDCFAEYPPEVIDGRRGPRIDYVWAARARSKEHGRLWIPVAAFEVEGLDVPEGSLRDDALRLKTIAGNEDIVTAVVLYRTTEAGWMFWTPGARAADREAMLVRLACARMQSQPGIGQQVEVIVDHELLDAGHLDRWVARARERLASLRASGRAK